MDENVLEQLAATDAQPALGARPVRLTGRIQIHSERRRAAHRDQ